MTVAKRALALIWIASGPVLVVSTLWSVKFIWEVGDALVSRSQVPPLPWKALILMIASAWAYWGVTADEDQDQDQATHDS